MTARPMFSLALAMLTIIGVSNSAPAQGYHYPQPPSAMSMQPKHVLLTENLLDRLGAVARAGAELKKSGALKPLQNTGGSHTLPSLKEMGKTLNANPQAHALLSQNGFDGYSYISTEMTLSNARMAASLANTKWAAGMNRSEKIDPRNIAFYREHKEQADRIIELTAGSKAEADAPLNYLRNTDPDTLHDCYLLAPAMLTLVPMGAPGSAGASPSLKLKAADNLTRTAKQFNDKELGRNVQTIADVLRRQKNARQIHSPIMAAALKRLNGWAQDHCKNKNE